MPSLPEFDGEIKLYVNLGTRTMERLILWTVDDGDRPFFDLRYCTRETRFHPWKQLMHIKELSFTESLHEYTKLVKEFIA